jgi:histidine ammonia-lyase
LVDANSNGGVLPMFLTKDGGLESGFMIAQYTAAALASENKVLAHPASADTIPSSANIEDHVSMGATAVRQAEQILTHVETIVGIEMMAAAQGVDFRREGNSAEMGIGTRTAYDIIRKRVPFLDGDVFLAPHIEQMRRLVHNGRIKDEVDIALGEV